MKLEELRKKSELELKQTLDELAKRDFLLESNVVLDSILSQIYLEKIKLA